MAEWNPQANEIFLQAMQIEPPAQRQPFVDKRCGSDAELRAQVESLLHAAERAGRFLEPPTGGVDDAAAGGSAAGQPIPLNNRGEPIAPR